jgi:protein AbiQ
MEISFFTVSTNYISFLRSDQKLIRVYDNKDGIGSHCRKYLGVVLDINTFNYYVPLSSPKISDYDDLGNIRKDLIPIIRIICNDKYGNPELKGSIRFSNMIPVPNSELNPYYFASETDLNYKTLVEKEYEFIKSNQDRIYTNAKVIYNQKTKEESLYKGKQKPNYLASTIDFVYLEQKCIEYSKLHTK